MNQSSIGNFNEADHEKAINAIRLLAFGIPINDDNGQIIGWIERPNLEAAKYIISESGETESESDPVDW